MVLYSQMMLGYKCAIRRDWTADIERIFIGCPFIRITILGLWTLKCWATTWKQPVSDCQIMKWHDLSVETITAFAICSWCHVASSCQWHLPEQPDFLVDYIPRSSPVRTVPWAVQSWHPWWLSFVAASALSAASAAAPLEQERWPSEHRQGTATE